MADANPYLALSEPAAQGGASLGAAPPPNLLSTTLGPDGSTEKPKNPYIERLFRRPRLSPSEGVERGKTDRFWMNVEAAKRQTVLGAGEAAVYGNLPEAFDPRNPMEVEDRLRFSRIKRKSEEYEAMRPARTPFEFLAAGAGQVAGALTSPETLASLPTRFVTGGATAVERMFRAGVSGAAINTAIDPVIQGLRVQTGLQERYEPRQTALSLSLGFALPAAGQGVVEALKPAARVAAGTEAKASPEATRAASEALSPDAPYARQVPPPEPLKPVATMDALSPEDAARKIDEAAAALRAEADIAADVASAFPDRPVVAETAVTPAVSLRQEIGGKTVVFPDPQHARLYSLGRVLSEGAAPDGAELQVLAKEFQDFGVETVDDLAVVARDYHAGMTEQAQLSTADTLPARDILPDDAARSAWRDREIERLQESDPARAIIDETLRTVRARFGEEFTPRAPQEFAPTVAFDEVLGIDGIRVFHGSPHEFERFSMEEIGTGEGAQSYGHGLYFAQSRGVAESYKTRLAGERYSIDGHPHDPTNAIEVAQVWRSGFNTLQEAIDDLTEMAVRPPALMPDTERLAAREALQLLKNRPDSVPHAVVTEGGGGALYEARIRAKEEDFLDWDKPLSEQSEKVKAAVAQVWEEQKIGWRPDGTSRAVPSEMDGQTLYQAIAGKAGKGFADSATQLLGDAGIPGIKYLDRDSRVPVQNMSQAPTRNYVVFDDSLISTVRRNEQLMLRTPESLSSGAGARFQETPSAATAERGADGKPQLVIPGTERIAPAEQAQRAADEPLRPTAAQRPMDEGLFGDSAAQTDLMDLVRKPEAPIVQFRKQAKEIEASLPPIQDGMIRLWRGNRPGEGGQNPQFTNDLAGIALPFAKGYGGGVSYVDVPEVDLAKYVQTAGAATDAEFALPPALAAKAKAVSTATTFAGERIPEFTPEAIPATPGQRAGIFMFDPAELQIDARKFQFKAGGDEAGVTPILRGVSRWNPDAAGQLVVWQREDGQLFVADGHQRVNLAKRLLETGSEQDIRLPAVLYRETDGFSAEDVMIAAAMKNIREGSGDVMDAARILRARPEARADIAEISRTQTRQAVALADLEESVFRMVLNDVIEPRDGAIIGRLIAEPELQAAAAKAVARVKPANEAEAEILVRRVRDSELVKSEDASQGSMFGDLESADSLVAEETRIVAQAMNLLGRDKTMLKRVAANADRIEQVGSTIARDATMEAAADAERLRAMVESLAFRKGPARDKLIEAAKGLKNGSLTTAGATESFIEGVRLATGPNDAGRRAARGRGHSDASSGEGTFGFVGARRGAPFTGELDRPALGVAAGAGPAAERLRDISERVVAALGLTVRQGRITKRKALGTFSTQTGVTRLKELDAFDVLAHEGGHAFHLIPANKAEVDGLIAAHSLEVQRLAYQGAKPGTEDIEGFAEWFRLWVTNPLYAAREAPAFTPDFTRWMEAERPDIFRQIVETQDAYRNWLQAPSKDLVTGDLVTSAAPKLPKRVAKAVGADRLPTGESLFSFFDRFYTWTLDSLHPVNRAVSVLAKIHERNTGQRVSMNAASNAYKILRLATNSYQAGHVDLTHGVVPYHGLDPEGASLAEALELAVGKNWFGSWRKDELLDFGGYLVARRSIVEFQRFLAGEVPNPPGKLTLGDYRQAVRDYETESPNFARAAALYYEWNTNLLRKERDSGWRSASSYENALLKRDYAPLNRDFSEKVDEIIAAGGGRGTNRQSVMKTYRGSLRSVINPIESSIARAYDLAAFIARNDATNALDDLSRLAGPGGGAIAERIPSHQMKPIKVDLIEALRSAGKDAGLNTDDVDDLLRQAEEALGEDNLRTILYRAGEAPEKGEPIIYGWRGGERYALRLPDKRFGKALYEAMTGLGQEQSNWVTNMLAVPARVLRAGITTSPEFLLVNFIRDQISAFILNPKYIPFVSGAVGVATELRQGRAARLYAQAGGMMGGANVASLDQARIGKSISALQKKGYSIQRLKDFREILKLTEVTETGTRVALFKQYFNTARKQGLTEYEAMVEAAFQARDYMDFGRHGSKMLFARRVITFMNAALQGTDKELRVYIPLAKVFRGQPLTLQDRAILARSAGAWTKVATLTALGATYTALLRDEPEYQEASEYLRATHVLIKGEEGKWYAAPKPFGVAAVAMNFGERAAEALMADDPTWADKWMRSWNYTMAIPWEPAGLLTPAELAFNYDTFRDKPIVPQWDLGKDPALQFNSYTSEFSKKLGAAIGVSPAKIDHLIVGWTGSWGRNSLAVSNAIGDPQRRSSELYDWPITGRFVKNLARGSDATEKFYGLINDTGGRLELKNNTYKTLVDRGQEAEAVSYLAGLTDDEKVWVALNAQEKADNKRMHPLRRASDVAQVLSGIRRDITNRNLVGVLSGEPIALNPSVAQAVQDQLIRAAAAEMRNAMVAVGEPGWAQRQALDVTPFYAAIRSHAPTLADEIDARLAKKKVLPFEGVRAVWPELRDRLLKDGLDAFIGDLRPLAMETGERRRRTRPTGGSYQGVMLSPN